MSVRQFCCLSRGPVRTWASLILLAVASACVGFTVRVHPVPALANGMPAKSGGGWNGLKLEADTTRLADRHLWITIRVPESAGQPARAVRYDAYRQVLAHYGDARKIPSSFTVTPALGGHAL